MIRFFYDHELRKEHFVLNQLIENTRFKNRFVSFDGQRIRKDDYILISSRGTEIQNVDTIFSNAISFTATGFDFTNTLSFKNNIKVSVNTTLTEFNSLLDDILTEEFLKIRRKITKNSKNAIKEIQGKASKDIKISAYYKRKMTQYEQNWLDCKNLKEFYGKLNDSLLNFMPKKIHLVFIENITIAEINEKKILDFGSTDCFLTIINDESLLSETELIYTFFLRVKKYFSSLMDTTQGQIYSDKITESFQNLNHPAVVTDLKDNIIIYNKPFLSLNLTSTDLKKIAEQKSFKFLNKTYHLKLEKLSDFKVYYFKLDTNIPAATQDQDLGIISSSIAHELNNPIAAVLAALEVLKLEMDDPEKIITIQEMTAGARRCQKLTQTFLGFSSSRKEARRESFQEIFNRAYELVRFREIENNLKFKYHISKDVGDKKYFSSTMIMAIYLILNSILLSYHRFSLVSQENINFINTNISHKNGGIVFEFQPGIHLNPDLLKSKLLDFLLKEENLKLKFESSIVTLFQI